MIGRNIIIKKADKGSLTVIQDRDQYVSECFQHLFQSSVYKVHFQDSSHDIYRQVVSFLFEALLNQVITREQHNWAVIPRNFIKTPYFYALKKVHKTPMTIRPIISGINGPTTRLSGLFDYYLKPIASTSASYIRDSKHFIRVLEETVIPEDAILFTLDVKDLYTNIPQRVGIEIACQRMVQFYKDSWLTAFIRKSLELILYNNYFLFDDTIFHQILGTAMGTKCAPSYAKIFMCHFEEAAMNQFSVQPFMWKRSIDVLFFVWTHGRPLLLSFIDFLNSNYQIYI